MKTSLLAAGIAAALLVAPSAHAAKVKLINKDVPGVGLNDSETRGVNLLKLRLPLKLVLGAPKATPALARAGMNSLTRVAPSRVRAVLRYTE